MGTFRTQVAVIGGGPAGLMLSHLLHLRGVDSIVLEAKSRAYCKIRIRAGVPEYGTLKVLREAGMADRLDREGMLMEGMLEA